MAKKLHILFLIALFSCNNLLSEPIREKADSNMLKLNRYLSQIISETPPIPDSLIKISDYLISAGRDTTMQSYVARYLFELFSSSNIMGMENPRVHIAKKYFLSGKLKGLSQEALLMLKLYVDFNEMSLIGMDASELIMLDTNGVTTSLRSIKSKYTLVYFYDDQCKVCKIESPKIKAVLNKHKDMDISVYAVYTQTSKTNWIKDINISYPKDSLLNKWYFVWDPQIESNFQKLYAVISTPQVFLLDSNKKIIGRSLNGETLNQLLNNERDKEFQQKKELNNFFNNYFANYNMSDSSIVISAFKNLFERSKNNPPLYREIFTELFSFLKYSDNPNYQNCSIILAEQYIINQPQLWDNQSYIQSLIHQIALAKRNKIGSYIKDVKLYTIENTSVRISEIKSNKTILYFFNPDCKICTIITKEVEKLYSTYKDKGVEVIAIYTGSNFNEFVKYVADNNFIWISVWDKKRESDIYNQFDLSVVPSIYLLDRDKKIIAKDINTITLEKLIK